MNKRTLSPANPRHLAWVYLCALLTQHQSLSFLLKSNDSAVTKALCFGVCRHFFKLEKQLDSLIEKRPKSKEVWVLLLLGAYQLLTLKHPDYAVVSETVALLNRSRFSHAKGFVNSVLRRVCERRDQHAINLDEEREEGHWLDTLIQQDWPDDWMAIQLENQRQAPMSLRVNEQIMSRQDYQAQLVEKGIEAELPPQASASIVLTQPCEVTQLPGFSTGWVSVQDVAAQLACDLLSPQPGAHILDACAAPGGKICHLLERMPSLARAVALDKDPQRLKRVNENLTRLGLKAEVLQGDALHPDTWWDGQGFDRILLDAPCSATGVIRRHPDIRLLRTNEDIQQITLTQQQLLQALWPLLKAGGRLVYATCSVLRRENDLQIQAFLAQATQVNLIPFTLPWGRKTAVGWQLLPGEAGGDGFYYSVLEKPL